jgi:hypothetical protein
MAKPKKVATPKKGAGARKFGTQRSLNDSNIFRHLADDSSILSINTTIDNSMDSSASDFDANQRARRMTVDNAVVQDLLADMDAAQSDFR